MSDTRREAHELIDSLPDNHIARAIVLLRKIADPAALDPDDEPVTDEDRVRLHEGQRWFAERGGKGVSMDEVLAEYGLKPEDFPAGK